MNYKYTFVIILWMDLVALAFLLSGCEDKRQISYTLEHVDPQLAIQGKQLSEKYCQSCHLLVGPEWLDKESWSQVLPVMNAEMEKSNISISAFDWILLQNYFSKASHEKLPDPIREGLTTPCQIFQKASALDPSPAMSPSVTLVKYDKKQNLFCIGDAKGNLFLYKDTLLLDSLKITNIPIDVHFGPADKSVEILGIGSLLPSEETKGSLIKVDSAGSQRVLIGKLKRPVHFLKADFDGNGKEEYLISSFGSTIGRKNSGKVSLFSLQEDGQYREYIIKALPGATKTVTGDFNSDKKLDFMALFSQGKESIVMFLNKGNLEFKEKQLLEFLPVYGSNSFVLTDMNDDSFEDIVFTNGDNGDYSPVFKSYHGLRIFLNDGHYQFKEAYFFSINGASKAICRDFDLDGDHDIVVLAMYPNFEDRAQETLIYFENTGDLNFLPSYIEKEPSGKWLVMDAGDINSDGKEDLLVGANLMLTRNIPASYEQKWVSSKQHFAVFKNVFIKKEEENVGIWQKIKGLFPLFEK